MDGESASFSKCAINGDGAAVHLGDVFDYRKAQAGAAKLSASALVNHIKTLENAVKMLLGYSASVILH